jgi:hypothetical protein
MYGRESRAKNLVGLIAYVNDRKFVGTWRNRMETMKRADPTRISPWPASQEFGGIL